MRTHSSAEAPREEGNVAGEPRSSSEKAGGKRERILEAAVRVFAEKSFYTATVAEIAREAGVADGTIYLYFKGKDDVLICLFEERMAELNVRMRGAVETQEGALARLTAFVHLHLSMVRSQPALAEVLTVELRQSAKLMKEYEARAFGEYLDILAAILEQGKAEGSIRTEVDVKAVRRAIFGALDEVALSWLLGGRRFDLEKNAAQLSDLLVRGLSA
jgi:TetR/AcrR family transcriptional regulator, fatty acid metabolism regulator protein